MIRDEQAGGAERVGGVEAIGGAARDGGVELKRCLLIRNGSIIAVVQFKGLDLEFSIFIFYETSELIFLWNEKKS